jgi:hypothetical protein
VGMGLAAHLTLSMLKVLSSLRAQDGRCKDVLHMMLGKRKLSNHERRRRKVQKIRG